MTKYYEYLSKYRNAFAAYKKACAKAANFPIAYSDEENETAERAARYFRLAFLEGKKQNLPERFIWQDLKQAEE